MLRHLTGDNRDDDFRDAPTRPEGRDGVDAASVDLERSPRERSRLWVQARTLSSSATGEEALGGVIRSRAVPTPQVVGKRWTDQ